MLYGQYSVSGYAGSTQFSGRITVDAAERVADRRSGQCAAVCGGHGIESPLA